MRHDRNNGTSLHLQSLACAGGWYDFEASAPYNGANGHRTGIAAFDSAGNALWTEWGDSGYNFGVTSTEIPQSNVRSTVRFRRCLCLPTYVEVVQYVTAGSGGTGSDDLGKATDQDGVEEKYSLMIISEACCC